MEKVPKKKGRQPWKKRTVLLALAACAIALGAAAWLLNRPQAAPFAPGTTEAVMLLDRPVDEVASLRVTPREGDKYTLVLKENSFVLMGHEDEPLRGIVNEELRISAGDLPAESVLIDDLEHSASVKRWDFGLEPAWAAVEIIYQDGEKAELLIGDLTPNQETPQRYCVKTGDPRLFTLLTADSAAFGYRLEALRAFDQPSLNASLLDGVIISGDKEMTLRYTPSGWLMDAPWAYPVSLTRMDGLLEKITGMRFEACLGKTGDVDLKRYGLDEPALRIALLQAASVITGETAEGEQVSLSVPEKEYSLLLGDETGKSGVYLIWEDQVYLASNFLLGFWKEMNPRDYLLRAPVNFLINNLSRVTFSTPSSSVSYEVEMVESITENNQIATDEYGRVLYDCAVKRGGEQKEMDAQAFTDWYLRLAALSADGDLPDGFTPAGECRAAILLENESLTRRIEFYPYDALHDAMAVDGTALFYIQKSRVDEAARCP